MANSKVHGSLGFSLPPLKLELRPARSPGSLGCNDAADPSCSALLGDSQGPLGSGDHGEPGAPPARLLSRKLGFREANKFEGTPVEQAKRLLSDKKPHGRVIQPLVNLPEPLESLIGTSVMILDKSFDAYLVEVGVREAEIGGPLYYSDFQELFRDTRYECARIVWRPFPGKHRLSRLRAEEARMEI